MERQEVRRRMAERPNGLEKPVSSVGFFAEHAETAERSRIRLEVRLSHLKRQNRTDQDAAELHHRTKDLEDYIDGKMAEYALCHPTAKWWRRVTGCHVQTMAKILGHVDQFGRWYPKGDPMIPVCVTRAPEMDEDGAEWVWVKGIERLTTPSKLMAYAGLLPDSRRKQGRERESNTDFRTILYRLMQFGFMFGGGPYRDRYQDYKQKKLQRLEAEGVKVLPTPKGRFCPTCNVEKTVPKDTSLCPDCDSKLGKKEEPQGVLWAGHLDNMARRWTIKLFLSHLWVIWRTAEGLPLRVPYAIEHMPADHSTVIDPWEMCDLPVPPEVKVATAPAPKPKKARTRHKKTGDGQETDVATA